MIIPFPDTAVIEAYANPAGDLHLKIIFADSGAIPPVGEIIHLHGKRYQLFYDKRTRRAARRYHANSALAMWIQLDPLP